MVSFWCLVLTVNIFQPCSSDPLVNFEQVNAGRDCRAHSAFYQKLNEAFPGHLVSYEKLSCEKRNLKA